MIRPRNVDQNKKLLVTTEREDSTTEMQVPRAPNIEVPKIEFLDNHERLLKMYKAKFYHYKHLTLPDRSLENILGYEITEEDLELMQKLIIDKNLSEIHLNSKVFEKIIEISENDTSKGQIIPFDRVVNLVKESKVCEKLESAEDTNLFNAVLQVIYDHWVKQREKMGRPLMRKYWKSEGITDNQLRIAFQPRGGYREKMRLRNSRKNDYENYEKVSFM